MGPDNSIQLYRRVERGGSVARLEEETLRRVAIGQTLGDLSDQFETRADGQPAHIAEPVMVRKLYALAAIQRTRLGVAGFDPRAAINFDHSSDRVMAEAAPAHDSFNHDEFGSQAMTRAIKFIIRDYNGEADSTIEMFGLNLYIADPNIEAIDGISEPHASHPTQLLVVNEAGRATKQTEEAYISGETPIIAVRNSKTGDARVYLLLDAETSDIPDDLTDSHGARAAGQPLIQGAEAWVDLPDGQVQRIVVLQGDELANAAREFADAASALQTGGIDQLSVSERAAVTSTQRTPAW